jgi:hypothetical protein
VWEVLGSHKGKWEAYGIHAKGEEEAPTHKNKFLLEIHKRGGNSPWRAHHMGERKGKEDN